MKNKKIIPQFFIIYFAIKLETFNFSARIQIGFFFTNLILLFAVCVRSELEEFRYYIVVMLLTCHGGELWFHLWWHRNGDGIIPGESF